MSTKTAKNAPNVPHIADAGVNTASLPLPNVSATPVEPAPTPSPKKDKNKLPKHGLVKKKALAILALRIDGWTNEEIATELKIKPKSVNQYIYLAGRNGWLVKRDGSVADPADDIQLNVLPRVVRNLKEFLDSDDQDVRKEVTLKTAEGTIFQKFKGEAANAQQQAPMSSLTINIVTPPGGVGSIREGTTGGTPMFIEGETLPALPPAGNE